MNLFDKCCAAFAFALGAILVVIGAVGLFAGCTVSFRLPPILGVLPLFAGWGIFRSVTVAWRVPKQGRRFVPSGPMARTLYLVGAIACLVGAVVCLLLVMLTLSTGALPGESSSIPTVKVVVFGSGTVLLGAVASFCGSRVGRNKRAESTPAEST